MTVRPIMLSNLERLPHYFNHPFTNYSGHCLAHAPSAGYALVQALLEWMI